MADGAIYYFGMQRNEDYLRSWEFRDQQTDVLLDISQWSFELRIAQAPGLGPLLVVQSSSATSSGSVITPSDGQVSILIKKEDVSALPGRVTDVIPFAYNFIATDGAGIRRADVRGEFIVEPGV